VLSVGVSPTINWTYGGTDPTNWYIEFSADGISGWALDDESPGVTRSFDVGNPGNYYRITGVDGSDHPVTEPSNVVFVPL
jgi:hypothetical protein